MSFARPRSRTTNFRQRNERAVPMKIFADNFARERAFPSYLTTRRALKAEQGTDADSRPSTSFIPLGEKQLSLNKRSVGAYTRSFSISIPNTEESDFFFSRAADMEDEKKNNHPTDIPLRDHTQNNAVNKLNNTAAFRLTRMIESSVNLIKEFTYTYQQHGITTIQYTYSLPGVLFRAMNRPASPPPPRKYYCAPLFFLARQTS